MRTVVLTTAFLALINGVAAQPAPRPPPFRDPEAWQPLYMALTSSDPDYRSITYGGQLLAMAGREDLVYVPPGRVRKVCRPLLRDGKPIDAISYIAEAAAANPKVAMINEAHAEPLTRAFIAKVATALRAEGYTAYGAETFSESIAERGGPALLADGFFVADPVYGGLIRTLRRLDYRLFPYEEISVNRGPPTVERMQQREDSQAANLKAQVSRETGKVLVHVGHAHLAEAVNKAPIRMMGNVFKHYTGIDPLTIDLTWNESPTDDFVICDPASVNPENVDIFVGVPKLNFVRGRPAWRSAAGEKFAEVPARLRRAGQIAIYEARAAGESVTTIPRDRLVLRPGESLPLLLAPGRYDVAVWTEKDGWSGNVPLSVP